MSSTSSQHAGAGNSIGPTIVPLLAIAAFINYVDRGHLATAAPLIESQLKLSTTEIGLLLSAFFWSYTPAQVLAAWLAERINPYRTLGIGLALWSIATAASGLATGFLSLMALRVLLGIGESAAFPCTSKLLAQHVAPEKLGTANGLVAAGVALGPAFGTFVGGFMMIKIGWSNAFLVFGIVSLFWLAPWRAATRRASARADQQPRDAAPSFAAILRRREAWGASLGHFCGNYAFYFVISWLPLYLVRVRHLSLSLMATLGGLTYLVYAVSSIVTGRVSDRWIRAGASVTRVRKGTIVAAYAIVAASLLAAAAGSVTVSLVSLFCAGVAFGLATPTLNAIAQTLSGPRAGGKWMGVQNCVANLAGVVAPIVTGFVVDRTSHFYSAFIIAAGVSIAGTIGWGVVIRRVAPLDWEERHQFVPNE